MWYLILYYLFYWNKKKRTEDLWGTLVTRCHYYLCSCCDWLYNIIAAVSFFFPLLHRKCTEIHSYLILSGENYVYFYPPYSMESIIRLGCLTLLDAGFLRYCTGRGAHCTEINFALSLGGVMVKMIDLSKTGTRDFFDIILDQTNPQGLYLLPKCC